MVFINKYITPLPSPFGSGGLLWASGNTASCSAMGFFIVVFPLMTLMFNAYLSLSFMFTVRYDWREYQFFKYEKTCYVFAILFGLVHITNFKITPSVLLLAPILVLPQICIGGFLGFIRVRFGLLWSIALHGSYNGILMLISFAAM